MPEDLQSKLQLALWGAAAGGVVSIVVNLFLSAFVPRASRWNLTRHLRVYAEAPHGTYARCRVFNGGYWTIGQAMAYLSLEYTKEDVIDPPPDNEAFIRPDCFIPLSEDQLCWSVRAPDKNPMKVDIFAKEKQPLALCTIDGQIISIPSEEGWATPESQGFRAPESIFRCSQGCQCRHERKILPNQD